MKCKFKISVDDHRALKGKGRERENGLKLMRRFKKGLRAYLIWERKLLQDPEFKAEFMRDWNEMMTGPERVG